MAKYTADELVLAVVDPQLTLRGAIPEAYLGGYATTATQADDLATAMAVELASRTKPFSDAPQIVLLVDDYDALNASRAEPLTQLYSYLSTARHIGFHAVTTHRVASVARYGSPIALMWEAGAVGLIMSGDPSEGPLLGSARAVLQPPGRGRLVRPGRPPLTVQIAFLSDADNEEGQELG